jgi:hypothetical protein
MPSARGDMSTSKGAIMTEALVPDEGAREEKPDNEGRPERRRGWLLPTLTGVGGLVVGVLIGMSGETEPEVVVETVTDTVEVEVEPADLADQRSEWTEKMGQLGVRETELDEREEMLTVLQEGLEAREAELDERAAELDQIEDEIAAGTFPGNGTFLVGTDIEPGQYRNSGTGSLGMCYWARLSGTSGDFGEIIANGLTEGQTVVTIRESDVAFETQSCGEWTRV